MKYKVIIENNGNFYKSNLFFTDTIPTVQNGKLPKQLMPLTNTFMGGILCTDEAIEELKENTDIYGKNIVGKGTFSNSDGCYNLTFNSDTHIKGLAFTYADAVNNWDNTSKYFDSNNYIYLGNGHFPAFLDYENNKLYTFTDGGWDNANMILRCYRLNPPKALLKNSGWDYSYISYLNIDSVATLERSATIDHCYFNNNWAYSGKNFAKALGYDETYKTDVISVINYGKFNGHSVTTNNKYIFGFNYCKFNILDANDVVVSTRSFVEMVIVDKISFSYIPLFMMDFGGENQYRLICADDDFIYLASGENVGEKIYKISIDTLINSVEGKTKTQDITETIRYSIDAIEPVYVDEYSSSFCHIISRKEREYQTSYCGYDDERLNFTYYKGTNGYTGLFKQATAAIANFDITVSGSVKVYVMNEDIPFNNL